MKFLLAIVLYIASSFNVSVSQTKGTLVVYVTDKDNAPIANALVVIKEAGWTSKTTGVDGKALFEKSMPIGEVTYTVSKEGFQFKKDVFNITTEEKSNMLAVQLAKAPSTNEDRILITGEVTDKDEKELAGAIVEVRIADIYKAAKTDQSGNYAIEIVLNKSLYQSTIFRTEVKYNGACKKTETIDLTRSNVIYKDFKLDCQKTESPTSISKPVGTAKQELAVLKETVSGILEVTVAKCQFVGNKLICEILFENVSNHPTLELTIRNGDGKATDENGNVYYSELFSIANMQTPKYGVTRYELITGTKVKARIEFAVARPDFTKLSSLRSH